MKQAIILVILFGVFLLGVLTGLTGAENDVKVRICEKSKGKYDFCQPMTVYTVKEEE